MRITTKLPRRTYLQGLGAALRYRYWMLWAGQKAREPASGQPPIRLGFMYMPHGVIMDQFWPKMPTVS